MKENFWSQLASAAVLVCATAVGTGAQTAPPAGFQHQWISSAPDTCLGPSYGYTRGYQESPSWTFFTWNPQVPLLGYPDYYQVSWTLSDTSGQLASGSYDSRTGKSTGGTGVGGATFTISRTPVGDLTYIANVSYYTHQGQSGGSCGASYQEIANARLNSEWIALTGSHTYAFQSSETGYALTMPNASLGTQLIQSQYTSATDQQWTFSQWNAVGEYYAINASSKDSLFYDGTYNGSIKNPPVVQSAAAPYPSCSASAWRFVSAGDGSYYIVGVTSYNSGSCALMWFSNTYYSMTPQSTSSGAGIEASSLLNSSAQRWRVIVVK